MRILELLESEYPFGVAVPLQRPDDKKMAADLFNWTTSAFGASATAPEVLIVDHEKMQWAARRSQHHTIIKGQVYGWYSMAFPDKVFLSSQLPLSRSNVAQGTLVHEYTHYLQDNTDKHVDRQPFTPEDINFLEQEADSLMNRYTKSRQNGK
jgi:hypothetical protein